MTGTLKLSWAGPKPALDEVEMRLTELLVPPAGAVSLVKEDPTTEDDDSGWSLTAYFEAPPAEGSLETLLGDLALGPPSREELADRDWVAHALEGLGVVRAGAFVLFGSHDADKVEDLDGHRIRIEANRAFGTGHHPTTAGCLEALSGLDRRTPARILDLGTGSGILAIASRRLWPESHIVATDNDRTSVAIGVENAAANGVSDIHFHLAEGIPAEIAQEGPYDLVLANILAEPLIAYAGNIADNLAPGGRVVLAGMLTRQEAAVGEAFGEAGLRVETRIDHPVWPVLVLSSSP